METLKTGSFNKHGEYLAPTISVDKIKKILGDDYEKVEKDFKQYEMSKIDALPFSVLLIILQSVYCLSYNDASDIVDIVESLYNLG